MAPRWAALAKNKSGRLALAALALLAGTLPACSAGGYGRGKPHRLHLYAEQEWYLNHSPASELLGDAPLPEAFSWGDHDGKNWLTPSWNQHIPQYCGSCWVHGTLSMIQDRLKIKKLRASNYSPDVMLGRQTLLNCAAYLGYGDGCNGGEPLEVFKYMAEEGLPDESCLHYSATDHSAFKAQGYKHECPAAGRCLNCMPRTKHPDEFKCWPIKQPVTYKLTAYGKLEPGAEAMQREILARGPIVCGIACPEDFVYKYHSSRHNGVYVDRSGDTELDHDIEVVGWGVENGTQFWLGRNSWGSYWGELGFFRIERGTNALQIESGDCWYAEPEYGLEEAVVAGAYEGSMDGLKRGAHQPTAAAQAPAHPPSAPAGAALAAAQRAAQRGAARTAAAWARLRGAAERLWDARRGGAVAAQ